MDTTIKNAPPRIFLNLGDGLPSEEIDFASLHEVTWCADKQSANDVEYVLAAATVAADAAAPSVIAAAEALIAADRAQALTTEHVNALENAIAIQRGELKVPAAQPDERAALKRAMDLLDTKLGDTDPNIEGMTQDEIDTTYPVLSTMQILSELYCATERRATQRAMCTRVEISANSSHG